MLWLREHISRDPSVTFTNDKIEPNFTNDIKGIEKFIEFLLLMIVMINMSQAWHGIPKIYISNEEFRLVSIRLIFLRKNKIKMCNR